MNNLLKRRYVRGTEIELQNALYDLTAVAQQMRKALFKAQQTLEADSRFCSALMMRSQRTTNCKGESDG